MRLGMTAATPEAAPYLAIPSATLMPEGRVTTWKRVPTSMLWTTREPVSWAKRATW
ncbi:hypothetical protein D3C87_1955590 [compost metagenome]